MKVEHSGTGKHEEAGLAAAVMVHFHFCEKAAFAQEVGAAVKVVRDYFHGELLPSWCNFGHLIRGKRPKP